MVGCVAGHKPLRRRHAVFLAAGLVLAGCDDSKIVQKEEVKSPDGRWTARSEIEQIGGPGQDGVLTHVYLLRKDARDDRLEIVLLNDESVETGNIQMIWRDSHHLDLAHFPEAKVEFQVARSAGVEISVH